MRAPVVPVLTLLALALAGCGGEDEPGAGASQEPTASPTSSGPPPLPTAICKAVSAQEMSKAVGIEMVKTPENSEECQFDNAGQLQYRVTLNERFTTLDVPRSVFRDGYGEVEKVPGLGKPGFLAVGVYEGDDDLSAVVGVERGDYVSVASFYQFSGLEAGPVREGMIRIATMLAKQP